MAIQLTEAGIDAALPRVDKGLKSYLQLQADYRTADVRNNADFRRRFNGFYKVRRNQAWQEQFYDVLETGKATPINFSEALAALHARTNRCEASFASKLVATLDPTKPVIDAFVLDNVGMRLPSPSRAGRLEATVRVYEELADCLNAYLETPRGRYVVAAFEHAYPRAAITNIKKLDLVLWQAR